MSEIKKETEIEEAKEYFKRTIDRIKEMKITAKARCQSIPEWDKASYMNAKWSWNLAWMVYTDLQETWELMEKLVLYLFETEHKTTRFKETLSKLDKELEKYRPTLEEFRQALDQTQKTIRNGR